MNFDLTEDQRKLQATVADFAQSEVAPVAEALDRDGVFPTELFKKAGELGITAIPFSEDLGGMGLGVLDMVIALEQLARADQSLAVSVMVSVASGLTLGRFGDAELARKYLPDIIAGRKIFGIAGTEPNAGSDTSAFTTRASQRGNGWRLNGEKAFITNGGTDISSFLMILAVSSPPDAAKKSFTLFLVPNGAQGFTPGERYREMGWRSSDTRPYYLQDCDIDQDHNYRTRAWRTDRAAPRLPAGARVSGRVFARLGASLSRSLAGLRQGAQGLRSADRPFAVRGRKWSRRWRCRSTRRGFLTYRAAWNVDQGRTDLKQLAMAKLYACEAGTKCADLAIQVHGGWGYMDDCPVSRYYRDNRICTIGDGSTRDSDAAYRTRVGPRGCVRVTKRRPCEAKRSPSNGQSAALRSSP